MKNDTTMSLEKTTNSVQQLRFRTDFLQLCFGTHAAAGEAKEKQS